MAAGIFLEIRLQVAACWGVQQCNWLLRGTVVAVTSVGMQGGVLSSVTRTVSSGFLSGLGSQCGCLTGCWRFLKWHQGVVASYHCCVAVDQDYRAVGFALDIKNRMRMCSWPGEIANRCDHLERGGAGTRELLLALEGAL